MKDEDFSQRGHGPIPLSLIRDGCFLARLRRRAESTDPGQQLRLADLQRAQLLFPVDAGVGVRPDNRRLPQRQSRPARRGRPRLRRRRERPVGGLAGRRTLRDDLDSQAARHEPRRGRPQ